jgi:hypothetical protein
MIKGGQFYLNTEHLFDALSAFQCISVHLSASQCTQCTLHHSPSDFRLQQLFYTAYLWHFGSFEVSVVCVTFQNF